MSKTMQETILELLYKTVPGRKVLKVLVKPAVSRKIGTVLDSRFSTVLIKPFLQMNHIDLSDYEKKKYVSFNDFFTRRARRECRPIDRNREALISPCDGKAMVFAIDENSLFSIKKSEYNVRRLLRSKKLSEKYQGGTALLVRLDVTDYHRYCYIDDGVVTDYRTIPGVLHTVQPLANEHVPVYHENSREYCTLHSEMFGDVIVMEIGALLVGKIVNDKGRGFVKRGEEKGKFEYGGSSVILLFERDTVHWREDILAASKAGVETIVQMGERLNK